MPVVDSGRVDPTTMAQSACATVPRPLPDVKFDLCKQQQPPVKNVPVYDSVPHLSLLCCAHVFVIITSHWQCANHIGWHRALRCTAMIPATAAAIAAIAAAAPAGSTYVSTALARLVAASCLSQPCRGNMHAANVPHNCTLETHLPYYIVEVD